MNKDHVLDFNIYQEMMNNVDKKLVPQVKEMNKIYLWKWQKWTMKKLLGSLRVWYEKWKNPTSFYYNLGYALNSKYY